jgi:YD repeat-containing protein
LWTSYQYDPLKRLTLSVDPINATTRVFYHGLTKVSVNSLNQTKTEIQNVQGKNVAIIDNNGACVTFTYDSGLRLVETVDTLGNTISIQYNLLGAKTLIKDPDLGTVTYKYDSLGQLVETVKADGNITIFEYDLLGRKNQSTNALGTSVWIYDTRSGGIGKLSTVIGPDGYHEDYYYDTIGRLEQKQITINETIYPFKYYYNEANGLLAGVGYPSGFRTLNIYNSNGYLEQIQDAVSGLTFYTINRQDAFGRVLDETFGNGATTQRHFDEAAGTLVSIHTGNSSDSSGMQNLQYKYDILRLLQSQTDGNADLTERYTYDGLNRLASSTVDGRYSQVFRYNSIGNILFKSNMGNYSYGEDAGPHAVTQVIGEDTTLMYKYDDNGNMISNSQGTDISYTPFNKPQLFSTPTVLATFFYGPDNQKYMQEFTSTMTGVSSVTYFLDAGYQIESTNHTTRHKHILQVPGGATVMHTAEGETSLSTIYIHPVRTLFYLSNDFRIGLVLQTLSQT